MILASDAFRSSRPLVTIALIAISAVVFLYQLALSDLDTFKFTYQYGLIPKELTSGEPLEIVALRTSAGVVGLDVASPIPTWGTVFTSMFMHGGWMHIIGNMIFLWGFGEKVEAKLGHIKYLLFYLGAGIAAAWTQVAVNLDSQAVVIGASGAIFGVLGAYLIAFPYERATALLFVFFLMPLVFSIGAVGPADPGSGIAYMAHVGGFVAGVAFMAGYKFLLGEPVLPRRPWRPWGY